MKLPWWLPFGRVAEISPQELHQWLAEGRPVQLVDSRSGLEYRAGTIGDAVHTPLTELPGALDRARLDPKLPVVALCLSGHRSRPAVRILRGRGLEAYSLQGGVQNWKAHGFELQPPRAK